MSKSFGFVYLWHDTKHNKYIIGSHFGDIEDRYTTSTGGKRVKNIFKSRPKTMKRKILQFCYKDSIKELQKLEQNWLNLRPNIANNDRYYNLKQFATGGFDISIKRTKPERWISKHKSRQRELVKQGSHNFQDRELAQKRARRRVEERTHHFLESVFNRKPFNLFCNDVNIGNFKSKAHAVRQGIKANVIDKLRSSSNSMITIKRGSYKNITTNEKFNFKKGDILRYEKA